MPVNNSLEILLRGAKAGDEPSLNALCAEVRVRLLQVTRFKLRGWSNEDREDLVQDTIIIFSRNLNKIADNPLMYAHAILQKRIWNELDRARRKREKPLNDSHSDGAGSDHPQGSGELPYPDPSQDTAREIEGKIDLERVWEAIQSMSHEFCKPLLTALMQGMEIGEIWARFRAVEPSLKRNAFDRRVFGCRRRLWAALGGVL